jgi:hypothetical protein
MADMACRAEACAPPRPLRGLPSSAGRETYLPSQLSRGQPKARGAVVFVTHYLQPQ